MNDLAAAAPALPPPAAASSLAAPPPPPAPQRLPVRFTGSGGEYFRVWIVNLLLTILTLGIWSAWAKVRKTRYFWSNTQLAGAAFQYHGNPGAILRGRLLAGALFVSYSLAGRLSLTAGMVAGAVLTLLGPWLFYKSMRFKLANTSWRGLRFGFDSTAGQAYGVFAPAVVLGVLFVVALVPAQRVVPGESPNFVPIALAELALLGVMPWLHARAKAYQHGRARYGSLAFEFEPSTGAFFGLYARSFLVSLPLLLLLVLGVAAVAATVGALKDTSAMKAAIVPVLVVVYTMLLVTYGFATAFFVARLQRLVWTRTRAGGVRFTTSVTARGYLRIWVVNGLLTLLTVGLYWPWAAVATARYRLESTTVETDAPLDVVAAASLPAETSATGEGAVDLFGWDIGL